MAKDDTVCFEGKANIPGDEDNKIRTILEMPEYLQSDFVGYEQIELFLNMVSCGMSIVLHSEHFSPVIMQIFFSKMMEAASEADSLLREAKDGHEEDSEEPKIKYPSSN